MPKTWERYTDFAAWEAAKSAAKDADIAADAAREAKTAAAASEPDPRTTIVGELARGEASARLRIGPRRNKWRDLVSFDDRLAAVDVRQAGLREKLQEVQQRLNDEPARHAAELAVWHADGQVGEKPPAVTPSLEASLLELTADVAACDLERERLLRERADHVAKHRKQLAADVAKEVAAARARYESHIGGIEAARSDLLDMRATQVWIALFPHDALQSQPPFTSNLARGVGRHTTGRSRGSEAHCPPLRYWRCFARTRQRAQASRRPSKRLRSTASAKRH
jgi:hypothetical protein